MGDAAAAAHRDGAVGGDMGGADRERSDQRRGAIAPAAIGGGREAVECSFGVAGGDDPLAVLVAQSHAAEAAAATEIDLVLIAQRQPAGAPLDRRRVAVTVELAIAAERTEPRPRRARSRAAEGGIVDGADAGIAGRRRIAQRAGRRTGARQPRRGAAVDGLAERRKALLQHLLHRGMRLARDGVEGSRGVGLAEALEQVEPGIAGAEREQRVARGALVGGAALEAEAHRFEARGQVEILPVMRTGEVEIGEVVDDLGRRRDGEVAGRGGVDDGVDEARGIGAAGIGAVAGEHADRCSRFDRRRAGDMGDVVVHPGRVAAIAELDLVDRTGIEGQRASGQRADRGAWRQHGAVADADRAIGAGAAQPGAALGRHVRQERPEHVEPAAAHRGGAGKGIDPTQGQRAGAGLDQLALARQHAAEVGRGVVTAQRQLRAAAGGRVGGGRVAELHCAGAGKAANGLGLVVVDPQRRAGRHLIGAGGRQHAGFARPERAGADQRRALIGAGAIQMQRAGALFGEAALADEADIHVHRVGAGIDGAATRLERDVAGLKPGEQTEILVGGELERAAIEGHGAGAVIALHLLGAELAATLEPQAGGGAGFLGHHHVVGDDLAAFRDGERAVGAGAAAERDLGGFHRSAIGDQQGTLALEPDHQLGIHHPAGARAGDRRACGVLGSAAGVDVAAAAFDGGAAADGERPIVGDDDTAMRQQLGVRPIHGGGALAAIADIERVEDFDIGAITDVQRTGAAAKAADIHVAFVDVARVGSGDGQRALRAVRVTDPRAIGVDRAAILDRDGALAEIADKHAGALEPGAPVGAGAIDGHNTLGAGLCPDDALLAPHRAALEDFEFAGAALSEADGELGFEAGGRPDHRELAGAAGFADGGDIGVQFAILDAQGALGAVADAQVAGAAAAAAGNHRRGGAIDHHVASIVGRRAQPVADGEPIVRYTARPAGGLRQGGAGAEGAQCGRRQQSGGERRKAWRASGLGVAVHGYSPVHTSPRGGTRSHRGAGGTIERGRHLTYR